MNCREVLERLYEFLDAELNDAEKKDFAVHLEVCSDCLKYFKMEEELDRILKQKTRRCSDVERLKQRVLAEIDKMDRQSGSGSSRNVIYLLAPIAAAVVLTFVLLNLFSSSNQMSFNDLIGSYAQEHKKCVDRLKDFLIESQDPEEIRAALAHLGALPEQLFHSSAEITLAKAGEVRSSRGVEAHLEYLFSGENVSLFVLTRHSIDKSQFDMIEYNGKKIYFSRCPNFHYVLWENHNWQCLAVSRLDEEKLISFATSF